jgi:hypothetical protein
MNGLLGQDGEGLCLIPIDGLLGQSSFCTWIQVFVSVWVAVYSIEADDFVVVVAECFSSLLDGVELVLDCSE